MKDQIRIRGLRIYAGHGVYEEEKRLGQAFYVDAVLECGLRAAGERDELSLSVDYGAVCRRIEEVMTGKRFSLIEAAAEQTAKEILLSFPLVERVELTLHKPQAPIPMAFEDVAVRIRRGWHTAYVALGSNLGDPVDNLRRAAWALTLLPRTHVKKVSRVYKTKPVGFAGQDDFYNAAVKVSTALTPQALLGGLLGIEAAMGRVRGRKNGPRVIDLDLLAFEGAELDTPELKLPHPRMLERGFVLAPLCDISLDPLYRRALKEVGREGVEVIHDAIVV